MPVLLSVLSFFAHLRERTGVLPPRVDGPGGGVPPAVVELAGAIQRARSEHPRALPDQGGGLAAVAPQPLRGLRGRRRRLVEHELDSAGVIPGEPWRAER